MYSTTYLQKKKPIYINIFLTVNYPSNKLTSWYRINQTPRRSPSAVADEPKIGITPNYLLVRLLENTARLVIYHNYAYTSVVHKRFSKNFNDCSTAICFWANLVSGLLTNEERFNSSIFPSGNKFNLFNVSLYTLCNLNIIIVWFKLKFSLDGILLLYLYRRWFSLRQPCR